MRAPTRTFVREAVSFGGVGGVAFVVQLTVLNLLVHRHTGPLTANAAATVLSCAVAYAGNRWLSFRHRRRTDVAAEARAFVVVNVAALVVAEAVLATAYLGGAAHDRLVVNVLTVVGIGLGTLLRFYAYRRFVFVPGPDVVSVGHDRTPALARPIG